jgi:ADP-heptose:LPS heptosyltransferase
MGDVAMIVPLLRAFSSQYPHTRITVVSKPFFGPFFDGIPNLDFFPADLSGRHKGLPGLIRLYKDLRMLGADAFADLHEVLRSKIVRRLFAFSGFPAVHTDKARAEKKALTRAKNKIFRPLKTVVRRHADAFEALGFPIDLSHPEFPKPELDGEVLAFAGKPGNWIGIAPFAHHQGKVYPQDLMKKVIDALAENPSHKLFLFGAGEKESGILHDFAAGHENVSVVAGRLSFSDELQLIANLSAMLSMDSGNAHIAAMYGVPTVTLWGATHPFAGFGPFAQPSENALVADRERYPLLPTSVYGNKMVAGYQDAMRTISPESVVAKLAGIVDREATAGG